MYMSYKWRHMHNTYFISIMTSICIIFIIIYIYIYIYIYIIFYIYIEKLFLSNNLYINLDNTYTL